MMLKHRHIFPVEFKLRIVEKVVVVGNRDEGCYFDMDEKAVRNRQKQKQSLKNSGRKQSFYHDVLKWPE